MNFLYYLKKKISVFFSLLICFVSMLSFSVFTKAQIEDQLAAFLKLRTVQENTTSTQKYENLQQHMHGRGIWLRSTKTHLKKLFGKKVYQLGNRQSGVRARDKYKPAHKITTKERTVIVVVHGTWAQDIFDYHDPEREFYAQIRNFAYHYAEKTGKTVEVVSFRWSGGNTYISRREGAEVLAKLLNKHYANSEIITIAHSHGCNVVNHASRKLNSGMEISHIINIATPVRETKESEYKPTNFKRLTHFYSTSDWVAFAGAVTVQNYYPRIGSGYLYGTQEKRAVVNIRVQINGYDPGHSSIKLISSCLFDILNTVQEHYAYHTDLDLNLTESHPTGQLSGNTMITDKDTKSVQIAIRRPLTAFELVSLVPKNPNLVEDFAALQLMREVRQELVYSKEQELAFKKLYGYDIHEESHVVMRLGRGFRLDVGNKIPPMIFGAAMGIATVGTLGLFVLRLCNHGYHLPFGHKVRV